MKREGDEKGSKPMETSEEPGLIKSARLAAIVKKSC